MKIVITGTTGVGKSTTVKGLDGYFTKNKREVKTLSELVVESPFFDLYFKSLEEWGFLSQLDFLLTRFWQYVGNEIENGKSEVKKKKVKDNSIYLYDRHFLEDKIFAELKSVRVALTSAQAMIYMTVYNQILEKLDNDFSKIDYLILLKADFEEIMNRMKKRGRMIEKSFSRDYWLDLYNGYYNSEENFELFKKYSKNFIIIDTTNLSPDKVLELIIKKIKLK